jgi:hypothetical protein
MSHNQEKRVAKLEAAIGTSKDDPPVDSDAERKPNALDLATTSPNCSGPRTGFPKWSARRSREQH